MVSGFSFPIIFYLIRIVRKKPLTKGQFVEKAIIGVSAPPFLFLALSPLSTEIADAIKDQTTYLCMAGIIGIAFSFFSLFDD
ncbi:MAG: hypothetical protein H2049_12245 [Porphyrobacter sp.]|nr:hypothetical protein [Porphyrobacter sp.]